MLISSYDSQVFDIFVVSWHFWHYVSIGLSYCQPHCPI